MEKMSRKKELAMWRQQTGRTPMKRLSYLHPCATPRPVTPSVRKLTYSHLYSWSARQGRTKDVQRIENINTTSKKKITTRCVVKQGQSVLTPLNGNETRKTSLAEEAVSKSGHIQTTEERALMKKLFQQDIDDTVAEILAEQAAWNVVPDERHCVSSSDEVLVSRKKPFRRRSSAYYVDSELAFQSSKICYAMVASEHRGKNRKRRHTHATRDGDSNKSLLYLTPVRRTTRRSRSICPEPSLGGRGEVCFDSPRQAEAEEGWDEVRVIPNGAIVLQGK